MASVFLSYDRDDTEAARSIATALEKSGHTVWWDQHIRAGAQYSKEIEEALKSADAVVALWSSASVDSPWVRDEAAAGRDSGRLIPVSLDRAEPPLGFRQYQTIDLGRPRMGRGPGIRALVRAVEMVGKASSTTTQTQGGLKRQDFPFGSRGIAVAVVVTILLSAITLLAWRGIGTRPHVPAVMIASADQSVASKDLARDLFAKLGQLQASQANPMELVQARDRPRPDLILQVSSSRDTGQSVATIALLAPDGAMLWSRQLEGPAEHASELRQQLGFTAARLLECAREAVTSSGKLEQEALKLFLGGCSDYAELYGTSVREVRSVIPVFEQVGERAPRFEPAWAKLLLAESEVATNTVLPERRAVEESLRRHLAAARRLNPHMPEVLRAEILLLPLPDVTRRMELIDAAVETHPDNSDLLTLRSTLLMTVGRMSAAAQNAKHAAEVDVLSPAVRAAYIFTLAHSGQKELALHELARAQAIWPGAASLSEAQFSIDVRYGDPAAAIEQMRTGGYRSDIPASNESFLEARLHPTRENIARAISEASAVRGQTIRQWIQVLAQFGRNKDVIDELLRYDVNGTDQFTDVLFRPNTRRLRQDPRFMIVAKRFGLVDYWTKSGNWPDFCFEPDLPYDCKQEAAKLGADRK